MKPQKRIILVVSVLLITISCNFIMGNGQSQVEEPPPSKEEVKEEKEIKQEEEEEIAEEEILPTELPPPTDTPLPPTDIPEPEAISAADPEITIGEFTFRIIAVGYDSTALGMAPSNMGAGDQIIWVECELLSGDQSAFESLEITLTDGWHSSDAIILASNGMMQMLATVTMTGKQGKFIPDEQNIAWAYVFPKNAINLTWIFPSGEVVDLTPVMP